jgi:hypothetical protein
MTRVASQMRVDVDALAGLKVVDLIADGLDHA